MSRLKIQAHMMCYKAPGWVRALCAACMPVAMHGAQSSSRLRLAMCAILGPQIPDLRCPMQCCTATREDVLPHGADSGDHRPRESNRQKRLRAAVPLGHHVDHGVEEARGNALQGGQVQRRGRKHRKLSTQIPLLRSNAAAAPPGGAQTDGPGRSSALATSVVSKQHDVIQRYMRKAQLVAPTDVQLRCWPTACAGADVVVQVRPCALSTPLGMGPLVNASVPDAHQACKVCQQTDRWHDRPCHPALCASERGKWHGRAILRHRHHDQGSAFASAVTLPSQTHTPSCAQCMGQQEVGGSCMLRTVVDCLMSHACGVQAPTGTGKTLAYLLPMAARVADSMCSDAEGTAVVRGLVVVPTRELAQQTQQAAQPLHSACGIRAAAVHGGADSASQVAELTRGIHILVATPGRCVATVWCMRGLHTSWVSPWG